MLVSYLMMRYQSIREAGLCKIFRERLTASSTGIASGSDDSTVASNELGSGHEANGEDRLEGRHFVELGDGDLRVV